MSGENGQVWTQDLVLPSGAPDRCATRPQVHPTLHDIWLYSRESARKLAAQRDDCDSVVEAPLYMVT
jgi:hypothetical protein